MVFITHRPTVSLSLRLCSAADPAAGLLRGNSLSALFQRAEKSRKVDERTAAAGERNYNGAKPQQTIRGRRAERTRGSRSLPVFPLLGD